MVNMLAPGPVTVKGAAIGGNALKSVIVPVTPDWKVIVFASGSVFASRIACRNEPGPASFVLVTTRARGITAGAYSQKSFLRLLPSSPVPIYPLVPMLKPTAACLPVPPKSVFCVQVLVDGLYSQKATTYPVPIYPFVPIPKPTAACLAVPPKSVFWAQVLAEGSYSQKSFV